MWRLARRSVPILVDVPTTRAALARSGCVWLKPECRRCRRRNRRPSSYLDDLREQLRRSVQICRLPVTTGCTRTHEPLINNATSARTLRFFRNSLIHNFCFPVRPSQKNQQRAERTYSHMCIIHTHVPSASVVIVGRQWDPLGEGRDKLFGCLLQNVSCVPFGIDVKKRAFPIRAATRGTILRTATSLKPILYFLYIYFFLSLGLYER